MKSNQFLKEKLKTSEFRDVTYEKMLIAGMLKYKQVMRKVNKEVKEDIFSSDKCRNIYRYCLEFYNAQNITFDSDSFKVFLEGKPTIEKNSYSKLWDSIVRLKKKVKVPVCFAIMDKLDKFYQARILEYSIATTLIELKKAASNGGLESIKDAKEKYLAMIPMLENKSVVSHVMDPFDYYDKFKKEHMAIQKDPSLLQMIPTGLSQLDEIMGGLRPSEFGLITAGTGVGKSIMLADFAFHCWQVMGDVLYITIEMPGSQLSERVFCRLSGIHYENFRRYKLSDDHWKRLDEKVAKSKRNENKLRILDIPQSASVKGLKIEVEEFIRKHFEPKLIIIDYMNIMQGGLEWSNQLSIAMDIKQQIARYFKIATWSANQLMGSKHDKEDVKISDMAFAKNIVDNVDIGIGIGLTDASEDDGIFKISFTKTRDFKGQSFTICGDLSRMTFTKAKENTSKSKFKKKEIGGKLKC